MKTVLRSGTAGDATACGSICYEAFKGIAEQHNFPPDFPSPDIAISCVKGTFVFWNQMRARSQSARGKN